MVDDRRPERPGLPPNGKATFLGDSGTAGGPGTLARVRLAGDLMAVTAVRATDGTLRLSTWKLGGGGSPTARTPCSTWPTAAPRARPTSAPRGELVLAVAPGPGSAGNYIAVTADVTGAGAAALQAWRVNATTGAVTYLGATSLGSGRNISIADDGVGKIGVTYTTGTATTGTPRVEAWDVAHDGTFVRTMGWTETDVATATAIAPLGPPATKSGIVADAPCRPRPTSMPRRAAAATDAADGGLAEERRRVPRGRAPQHGRHAGRLGLAHLLRRGDRASATTGSPTAKPPGARRTTSAWP